MNALAPILIAASCVVLLFLGLAHVVITYRGSLMAPRERDLRQRMEASSPLISRETTMWKAWRGFNASHGLGVTLFALVYLEVALRDWSVLSHELVLQAVGLAGVSGWTLLAFRHWFSVPQAGVSTAALLYIGGLVALHA